MIRFGFAAAGRVVSASSRRFVRDVAASVLATAIGAVAVSHFVGAPVSAPSVAPAGKASERLAALEDSFVEETVPVRNTRIFDTLAMFSLPSAEPAAWSDRPAASARLMPQEVSPVLPVARAKGMPQMVTASAEPARHPAILPPARPLHLAAAGPSTAMAPTAPTAAEPQRTHISVFGWNVPGTDMIPTRRDAGRAIASVGRGAVSVGTKAVDTVGDTATGIGRAVSSAGSTVISAVGLD